MKYDRGPLVPSLLKLAGNVYIRHLFESRRNINGEPEIRKICLHNVRKGREVREVSVEEGSGQTQAAADHKGVFKPKPLSFRLLALTSLEVECCL